MILHPLTLPGLVFVCLLDVSQFSSAAVLHYFLVFLYFPHKHQQESAKKNPFLSFSFIKVGAIYHQDTPEHSADCQRSQKLFQKKFPTSV